jgi:hypothetical protein
MKNPASLAVFLSSCLLLILPLAIALCFAATAHAQTSGFDTN